MQRTLTTLVMALGLMGTAWAQDRDRPADGKDAKAPEPSVALKELGWNKNGKVSAAEILKALNRLDPPKKEGDRKEGGDRKPDAERGGKDGKAPVTGTLPVKEVDANSDERVTLSELKAAFAKLAAKKEGRDGKVGGDKKPGGDSKGDGDKE